jgi:hypothetical protein
MAQKPVIILRAKAETAKPPSDSQGAAWERTGVETSNA